MIGKTISHYKIIEKIGSGGMGIVYKAQDLKLDRFVALKFLPPHLTTSDDEKQRFIHEAKAASALQHNNICNIHEIDETEDGQLFICMDYYEGDTLDKKIKDKPLSIDEAIDISIQIAQGLAKAHEKEIVHRDIKPANIMLTKEGVVKVLDFGLAKLSTQTKLTKESTTLGTVSYMSPEQAKGEEVDCRTDIWSLGVIIYEMLTGQLPFKSDYDQALVYSIINDEAEPITGLRSGIPIELERIVNKLLAKSPDERYRNAEDLIVDLHRLKKTKDSKIDPTSELIDVDPSKTSFKSLILPLALLFITIIIVGGYFLMNRFFEPDEPNAKMVGEINWENSIAVLPFDDLSPDKDQEYLCDGIAEQIITNLSKLKVLKVIARTSVMPYKDTKKKIPEIGKELNVVNILEGSVSKIGNRLRVTAQLVKSEDAAHLWAENYDYSFEIDSIFAIYDDISEQIAKELLRKLSSEERAEVISKRPTNTEAYNYFMQANFYHQKKMMVFGGDKQDFEIAKKLYFRAIELDSSYAPYYANLTDLYNSYYNKFAETDEEKDEYLELQEKYLEKALDIDPNYSEVQDAKGWVHAARGEFEAEFECRKKAIQLNPNSSTSIENLAEFYIERGLIKSALIYYTRAIEADPLFRSCYVQRARCYNYLGEYTKAEEDLLKAMAMDDRNVVTLFMYTYFLIRRGEYDEADAICQLNEKYNPDIVHVHATRAVLYAIAGEKEKALETYRGTLIANIYAWLGMKDEFFDNFSKYENFVGNLYIYHSLKTDPDYRLVRDDPRFQKILAKYKELYEENLRKYGDIDI